MLIRKPVLDEMLPSFLGRPVWNFVHRPDVDPADAFDWSDDGGEDDDNRPEGIVIDGGYDSETGMYYADMWIWDEETQENIEQNGYSVSCAYRTTEEGPGGSHNMVPYDTEVLSGKYHHMSVVEDPRYGESRIFANSEKEGIMKFRLNKGKGKKARQNMKPLDEEKKQPEDEEVAVNEDAVLRIEGESEEIPVSELVAAYKEKAGEMAENEDEDGKYMNMEDTVEIDGEEVSMKDLYENYRNMKANAEPPTDEEMDPPSQEDEEGLRSNSADDGKEKPNKNFRKIRENAARGAAPERPRVNTARTRLERGRNRYGTSVAQKKD